MKNKKVISIITTFALVLLIFLNSNVLSVIGKEVSTNQLREAIKSEIETNLSEQSEYIKGNSAIEGTQSKNETALNLEEEVRVIVQLDESPAIINDKAEYNESVKEKEEIVKVAQSDVISQVEAITGTTVKRRFGYLVNGFSINSKRKNIDVLRGIDGVKYVTEVQANKPSMESAKEICGATDVWKDYRYKGEGMVISIIDTGLDYTHKDLQNIDSSKIKLTESEVNKEIDKLGYGTYFTDKVPYGHNYADGNDDVIDTSGVMYEHGMHVAGIAAANGDDDGTSTYESVKGVAPEAQLLAMKVSSNNPNVEGYYDDDIIAAIEDSVKLGADVINMSIGGGPGCVADGDPVSLAVNNATDVGIICVIGAGNDQTSTADLLNQPTNMLNLKDTATVNTMSTTKGAFSIASMENDCKAVNQSIYRYESQNGISNRALFYNVIGSDLSLLEDYHEVVYCKKGIVNDGQDDFVGQDLKGKIALIERGENNFQDKYDNAIAHKASGVAIYNKESGGDTPIEFSIVNITSPIFSLGRADGLKIKEAIEKGDKLFKFKGTDSFLGIENTDKGDMSKFSSWGATSELEFKPEITAPGGNIFSLANGDSYKTLSGTSMASPYVAGSETLILQGMKAKNLGLAGKNLVEFAKNIAMNTAKIMIDKYDSTNLIPYSPRRQGAGLIQIENAIKNNVTITYKDGKAAAALKEIGKKTTFTLELKNYGSKDITYDLSNEKAYGEVVENNFIHEVELEGCGVTLDKSKVVVKANSTAEVLATLTVSDKVATENFVEGYIHFTSQDGNAPSLSVPFMGFYGDWNKESIVDAPNYTDTSNSLMGTTGLVTEVKGENKYLGSIVENNSLYIDKNKVAFSPNGDGLKDSLLPTLYMLRNSKELKVQVVDKDGNVVRDLLVTHGVTKNNLVSYTYYGIKGTTLDNAKWDGTVYNASTGKDERAKDGKYSIRITNSTALEGSREQVLDLPLNLDTVAPEITIKGVEKYKDDLDKTHYKLSWTEKDNEGGSGIDGIFTVAVDGKIVALKESDVTEVNGTYEAKIQFNEGQVNTIKLASVDNAGNYGEASAKIKVGDLKTIAFSAMEDGLLIGQADLTEGKYIVKGTASGEVDKLIINDKAVEISDNYFETPVDVKEGTNTVKVKAQGTTGNVIIDKEYKIILDTKNPEVSLDPNVGNTSPYYTTEDDKIKFNVTIKDDSEVNGYFKSSDTEVSLNITNGQATGEIELKDGLNAIKLVVADKAGNTTVKNIVVVKGDSSSKLAVTLDNFKYANYIKPSEVKDGILKVQGHVNKSAKGFKINGQEVVVKADLTFTYEFKLINGRNLLKVYAEDSDGKVIANYAYRIYYDEIAPKLSINIPLAREDENIYTNDSKFNINGKVTDNLYGYALYINGDCLINIDRYPISDEKLLEMEFSKVINLNDGLNHVSLLVKDEFDNQISDDIKVVLDRVAPNKPSMEVTSQGVTINTDEKQVDKVEYSFDGINYLKYTGKFIVEASTDIYGRVTDYAGNISEESKASVVIDTSTNDLIDTSLTMKNASTGDENNVPVILGLALVAVGVGVGLFVRKKRKK